MEKSGATPAWAVILAGGDGTRLLPLTTRVVGDLRPKQFCALFEGETLLDRTRRRVDLEIRTDRQVVMVTQNHEPYYRYLEHELAPGRLVVQPRNRGTGPGIVYPLLRIGDLVGDVPVVITPSDHYVSDDGVFMAQVGRAIQFVAAFPEAIMLLGIEAGSPEVDYGWIEHEATPLLPGEEVFPVRGFWEKPSREVAETLLARGCLWNSLVVVGWTSRLLDLVEAAAPELSAAFDPVRRAMGSPVEIETVQTVYAALPSVNFSRDVLSRAPRLLVAMPVKGVGWSDWGDPGRVIGNLEGTGREPAWLARARGR